MNEVVVDRTAAAGMGRAAAVRRVKRLLRPLRPRYEPIYSVALYSGTSPLELSPLNGREPTISRTDIPGRASRFVADPFMTLRDGIWHMYFETFNERRGLGEIGLATSADLLHWRYRGTVLAEVHHLSYPMLIEHEGALFMIPEAHRKREVRLYRAVTPSRWECVATLLQGPYRDMTVFRRNGIWWMFGSDSELHDSVKLFSAIELTGPWQEHPHSPVRVNDSRASRPAGRVVADGDALYRFAQDANPRYGSRIRALRIVELEPDSYREEELGVVASLCESGRGWNAHGMHHIDLHEVSPGRWVAAVDGWEAHLYLGSIDLTHFWHRVRSGFRPGTIATSPGSTPTNPGSTPTNPGTTSTNAGTIPTNPDTVSTNPGTALRE